MRQIKLDRLVRTCPHTPMQLHAWLRLVLDVDVPRRTLEEGSRASEKQTAGERGDADGLVQSDHAPFDYLVHTFFEGRTRGERGGRDGTASGPSDCVVWAGRGTGKTFLGAVATLLDLCFKPRISIKVLGGSLEQSQRMHEHLRRLFERPGVRDLLERPVSARVVQTRNGGHAQVLAASQTSVRGTRVQKLRCDEVDLFDREIWRAAQLTTRSLACPGPWGPLVRGSVEALSTMHEPGGLMSDLVAESERESGASGSGAPARDGARRLFRWSLLDVLGACDDTHACDACAISVECSGRVKARDAAIRSAAARAGKRARIPGYVSVEDALRLRARVDRATWESEMLCLRPRLSDAVYEMFEPRVHVVGDSPALHTLPGRWVAGMDFGIRGEAAIVLARVVLEHAEPPRGRPARAGDRQTRGTLWIEREHVESGRTMDELKDVLRGWQREIAGAAEDERQSELAPAGGFERVGGGGIGGHGIEWIGIDPAGHARNDQTGVSNAHVLRKAGFVVRSMRSPIMRGVGLVRKRLESCGDGARAGGAAGTLACDAAPTGGLFIRAACPRLIESLQRYRFDPKRRERAEPLKDGHDHACDALRYLIVNLDGREGESGGSERAQPQRY